jgi:hypothetical protein
MTERSEKQRDNLNTKGNRESNKREKKEREE